MDIRSRWFSAPTKGAPWRWCRVVVGRDAVQALSGAGMCGRLADLPHRVLGCLCRQLLVTLCVRDSLGLALLRCEQNMLLEQLFAILLRGDTEEASRTRPPQREGVPASTSAVQQDPGFLQPPLLPGVIRTPQNRLRPGFPCGGASPMCLHGSENTSCFPVGTGPPGALSLESKRSDLDPSPATLWLPVWCSVCLGPHVKYKYMSKE